MLEWYFRGFFDDVAPGLKYIQPLPDKPSFLLPVSGMMYFAE